MKIPQGLNSITTISNRDRATARKGAFLNSLPRNLFRSTIRWYKMDTKICKKCGIEKPVSKFSVSRISKRDGTFRYQSFCNPCKIKYAVNHRHEIGYARPMQDAMYCSSYLGIYVAERALSKIFDNIKRMPNNNPGYDFICGRGFKIDVKSSCLTQGKGGKLRWGFHINRNTTADYFLCLAFNNRENLEPMHVWLIPGHKVNDKLCIHVTDNPKSLARLTAHERPLDKVIACCSEMRGAKA